MYSRGNYNFLRVVNARECASASDPFTVASTFKGTRVFSREECILACERLACVARASREVCYLSRERYCTIMYDSATLRSHLKHCFVSGIMEPFPGKEIKARRPYSHVQYDIFCS